MQSTSMTTFSAFLTSALLTFTAFGQSEPVNGMRTADLRAHAIVDATVVVSPGVRLEHATIVIRDGVIMAVGQDVNVPLDARVRSGEGMTIYPGLIDAALLIDTGDIDYVENIWKEISNDHPFEYSFLDDRFERMYHNEMKQGEIFRIFAGFAIVIS